MKKISFLNELEKLKKLVWGKIQEYLPNKFPQEHYTIVREYPQRQGKYFRPGLTLLSTEMFGSQKEKAILTAAAMQTSEDWLLIHDDFLDHSEERRSTKENYCPTLNKIYGDELAVNAGDALHIIMWKMLGDNIRFLGARKGWQIFNKMNDILLTTIEGQYLELDWLRKRKIFITEKEYYQMISIKAGYYTTTGPLQLGAIVAGAPNKELIQIKEWGNLFGCAFQIWDDVMNLTMENEIQGKEKAGDILEGKRTLILIHLLRNCLPIERDYITTLYAKPRTEKTEQDKEYILSLMKKYKSIDFAKKTAKDFSQKAEELFNKNTSHLPNSYAKRVIRQGIKFVANRQR